MTSCQKSVSIRETGQVGLPATTIRRHSRDFKIMSGMACSNKMRNPLNSVVEAMTPSSCLFLPLRTLCME